VNQVLAPAESVAGDQNVMQQSCVIVRERGG
jgi:hypothetical protein